MKRLCECRGRSSSERGGWRVIGSAKTTELFVWSINGPKRFGFNEFSSEVVGKIADTKKPAGLAPCGLSGLHRMTLVITDGEFWWAGVLVTLILRGESVW